MEVVSRFLRLLSGCLGCKRSRLSLCDLPPGQSWATVVHAGLTVYLAFPQGIAMVPTMGLGLEAREGEQVSYFRDENYECLTFIEKIDRADRVRVLDSSEDCLILAFFDQLDYFNLPASKIERIDGQLEVGGTALLFPSNSSFILVHTGSSRRPLRSARLPCLNPAKHARGSLWSCTIPRSPAIIAAFRSPIADILLSKPKGTLLRQQVEALGRSVTGWRSVRGDGNCYYRAVGVAILEHLARKSTEENEVWEFRRSISKAAGLFAINPGFEAAHSHFLVLLDQLIAKKVTHPGATLHELQSMLQTPIFDQSLYLLMRNYAYNGVRSRSLDGFQISRSSEPEEILIPGVEAEGIALIGLPEVLCAAIFHYILDGKSEQTYVEKYFPSPPRGKVPLLLLAFLPGHYDLLYSASQDEVDGFNYEDKSFDVSASFPQASIDDLYVSV